MAEIENTTSLIDLIFCRFTDNAKKAVHDGTFVSFHRSFGKPKPRFRKVFITKIWAQIRFKARRAEVLQLGNNIFGEVFCFLYTKKSSKKSSNCLLYVTIGYKVSNVTLICILWQYFVISKYLQFLTQRSSNKHYHKFLAVCNSVLSLGFLLAYLCYYSNSLTTVTYIPSVFYGIT